MPAVEATRSTDVDGLKRRSGVAGIAVGAGCLLTAGIGLAGLGQSPEPLMLPGVAVIGPSCRRDVYVREYVPPDGGPVGETWIYSLRAREPEERHRDGIPVTRLARGRLLWSGSGFTVLLR